MSCSKQLTILNKKGLHARAASLFVKEAGKYTCDIFVKKDGQRVSAQSIMGLLMLGAAQNTQIEIIADGLQEQLAIKGLSDLVNNKFFEEE